MLFSDGVAVLDDSAAAEYKTKYEQEKEKRMTLEAQLNSHKRQKHEPLPSAVRSEAISSASSSSADNASDITTVADGEQYSDEDIDLNCPFLEKDECKALGGSWDPDKRTWYVPAGVELTQFSRWRIPDPR